MAILITSMIGPWRNVLVVRRDVARTATGDVTGAANQGVRIVLLNAHDAVSQCVVVVVSTVSTWNPSVSVLAVMNKIIALIALL